MQEHQEKSIFDARWLLAVPFTIGLTVMAAGFLFT
jgi:hypothetical protein